MPIVIGATIQTDPGPLRRSLDHDAKMAKRKLGGAFRNIGRIGTAAITGIGRAMRRLVSLPAVIGAGLAGFGLDRLIRQGAELELQIGALAAQLSKSREEVSRYVSQIDQGTAGMLGFGGAIKAANRAIQQGVPTEAVAELARHVTLLRTAAGSADGIENDLDMLFRAVGKGTNEGLGRLGLRLDMSSLQGLSTEERRARVLQQVLEGLRDQTQKLGLTGRETFFTYTGIYGNIKDITVELGRAVTRTEEFRNIALVLNRLTGSIAERLRKGDFRKVIGDVMAGIMETAEAIALDMGEIIARGLGRGIEKGLGMLGLSLEDVLGDGAAEMRKWLDQAQSMHRTIGSIDRFVGRVGGEAADPEGVGEGVADESQRRDPFGVRFRRELERQRELHPGPDASRADVADLDFQRGHVRQWGAGQVQPLRDQLRQLTQRAAGVDPEDEAAMTELRQQRDEIEQEIEAIQQRVREDTQRLDARDPRVHDQQLRQRARELARTRNAPPERDDGEPTAFTEMVEEARERSNVGGLLGEGFGDAINKSIAKSGIAMAVSFIGELDKRREAFAKGLGEAFAKMVGDWKDHGSEFGQSVWDFLVSDESAWTFLGTLILDGITDLDRWHDMGKAIWSAVESSPLGKWLIGQDQAGKPLSEKENAQARQNVTERPGGAFGTFMDEYARRLPFGGGLIGNWIDSNRPSFDRIPGTGDQEPPRLAPGGVPLTGREGGRPSFDHLSEAEKRRMQFGQGEARSLKEASSLFQQALQEQVIEIDVMQGLKDGGRFLLDAFIERSRQRTPQRLTAEEVRRQEEAGAQAIDAFKGGGRFLLDAFMERSRQRTPQRLTAEEVRRQEEAGADAGRAADQSEKLSDAMARMFHAQRDSTAEADRMIEQMLGGMA